MSEPKDTTPPATNPEAESNGQGEQGDEKKYSERELRNAINAKQEKNQKEIDKIRQEFEDYKKMAEMNEKERAKYKADAEEAERKKRERDVTIRENTIDAKNALLDKSLPTDLNLHELVVVEDREQTLKNVEILSDAINKVVEKKVAERMKGETPNDPAKTEAPKPRGNVIVG